MKFVTLYHFGDSTDVPSEVFHRVRILDLLETIFMIAAVVEGILEGAVCTLWPQQREIIIFGLVLFAMMICAYSATRLMLKHMETKHSHVKLILLVLHAQYDPQKRDLCRIVFRKP